MNTSSSLIQSRYQILESIQIKMWCTNNNNMFTRVDSCWNLQKLLSQIILTSLSCYNQPLLQQTYQSIFSSKFLRFSHAHKYYSGRIFIDPLSTSSCWTISILILKCTYIDSSLKHTNQTSQKTETNIHNHCLSSSQQCIFHPPHKLHGWCHRSFLIIYISLIFCMIPHLN